MSWCGADSVAVALAVLTACAEPAVDDVPPPDADLGPVLVPEPVAVYILGDSISANIGASEPGMGWGPLYHDQLDALVSEPLDFVNVAVAGAKSVDLVSDQLDALADRIGVPDGPVIVGITIGGNDLRGAIGSDPFTAAGDTLDRVEANLIVIADWFHDPERFPGGVRLFIANVYNPHAGSDVIDGSCYGWGEDRTLGLVVENLLDMWSARYEATGAAYGFTVIDALGGFADHSREVEDTWFADCMHPNDAGHAAMSRLFFDETVAQHVGGARRHARAPRRRFQREFVCTCSHVPVLCSVLPDRRRDG